MELLNRESLYTLETYAEMRDQFRADVMAHKRNRRLALGTNAMLYFEDRMTMQYQVQEMLRIEKIFEGAAIQEELDAYNPLIPNGSNWKATFMIEFPDVDELPPIRPIADEDLARSDDHKTSAVHFMRFELTDEQVAALKNGAVLAAGIDHDAYQVEIRPVADNIFQSLLGDLD